MLPPGVDRFVAGETAAGAIDHAAGLNDHDIGAILNLLGEHYTDRRKAAADARAYAELLEDIAGTDLRACISVKPTQLGLDISESCFEENLSYVVDHAAEHGVFVWLDMEDHTTTDATLDAFERHVETYEEMGVCLQANLRRTGDDLERLATLPGKVRLVKGAYDPPVAVAYQSGGRVDEATEEHLRYMFAEFDGGVALGSHDPELVTLVKDLHAKHWTPYEVQMLMGVRTAAQRTLANHHDVWQYVPYGRKWPSYFYRRLTESPKSASVAVRALAPV